MENSVIAMAPNAYMKGTFFGNKVWVSVGK